MQARHGRKNNQRNITKTATKNGLIRTVKKEIRILGLDLCTRNKVIGAVLRGGTIIDGVLRFPGQNKMTSRKIAEWVRTTRYYPELRAVMLHDPQARLDPRVFEKSVGLPLVQVLVSSKRPHGFRKVNVKRGSLWVKSSLPDLTLEKILSITWTFGRLPEPVRVAHLLARTRLPSPPSRAKH